MKLYGLIGYPLSHTFSPGYFAEKFKNENITDTDYQSFELHSIEDFIKLVNDKTPKGLNVTIPYKEKVIPYLDALDPVSEKIGAVNTIRFENGQSKGYNTDAYGFEKSLTTFLDGVKITNALILGTGGASKAVAYVLEKLGIQFNYVSRKSGFLAYDDLDKSIIKRNQLIVNTTPLGMSPNIDQCPNLPYQHMTDKHYLFDLIYNPEKTLFLKKGQDGKANIFNGYSMLIHQAEKSWEIWNQNK